MSLELENIIIIIDTREQNKKRIKAVEDWATTHGAIVEHSKLDLCDYALLGEFRGVPVNLGIEAKGLHDFATSFQDLPDKLARAYQLYDNVALFVEANNYSFQVDPDGFHATISNPNVRNGNADVLPLAVYENMLASFQKEGVHVRQLRSEAHFPYAIAGLLINIVKPLHTGLIIKDKGFISSYLNVLGKVPGIGYKTAQKLIECYPNMFWLCSASEESYKEILGSKTGSQLYNFIRNPELVTEAWRNGHFRDGTRCDNPCGKLCEDVNAYDCAGKSCKLHPDYSNIDQESEIDLSKTIKQAIIDYLTMIYPHALTVDEICQHFNIEQGDEDKESFLIYLKQLAWDKKITNTTSGLFQICNDKTDKSGLIIPRTPQQELEVHQAPVLSESQHYSHPGAIILTPQNKPGDAQGVPIQRPVVQGKDSMKLASFDKIPPSLAITHNKEQSNEIAVQRQHENKELDVFGKDNPDWEPAEGNKMNLRARIEAYLNKPHTLQECVDTFDMFQNGTVWEHVMRMKREGIVTEFDNKTFVMKVK